MNKETGIALLEPLPKKDTSGLSVVLRERLATLGDERERLGQERLVALDKEEEQKIDDLMDKLPQKIFDLMRLSEIVKRSENLHKKDDLKFLYEINSDIKGLGKKGRTCLEEFIDGRDKKVDLSRVFDCRPEQVALGQSDMKFNTAVLFGTFEAESYDGPLPASLIYIYGDALFGSSKFPDTGNILGVKGSVDFSFSQVKNNSIRTIRGNCDLDNSIMEDTGSLERVDGEFRAGGKFHHLKRTDVKTTGNAWLNVEKFPELKKAKNIRFGPKARNTGNIETAKNVDFNNSQISVPGEKLKIKGNALINEKINEETLAKITKGTVYTACDKITTHSRRSYATSNEFYGVKKKEETKKEPAYGDLTLLSSYESY